MASFDHIYFFPPPLYGAHLTTAKLAIFTPALLALAGLVYIIVFIAYQLLFHPFAKYPGPFLAKFTNGYAAYHAWKGDIHIDIWRCHEKYGKVVRFGPNRLLINTTSALEDVHRAGNAFQKAAAYLPMVHLAPNTFTLIDKEEHARKRRILRHGFSDMAMRTYEPTIIAHTQTFCSALSEVDPKTGWSPNMNVSNWCDYLSFDNMTGTVFGSDEKMLESEENRFVLEVLRTSNIRMGILVQQPSLAFRKLDYRLFPACISARNRFIQFVSKIVSKRIAQRNSVINDLFSILLSVKDPNTNKSLSMKEIGAEAITLIVAGSDTSATLLTTVFFYLSRYPDVYAKVEKEVRSTFSSISQIHTGAALSSCIYLRACIDESLRMSPAVGGALWREAEAGGALVDEIFIPAGCDVGTGIYSIHHSESYYPSSFIFRPERWLSSSSSKEEVARARAAATGFGLGPRGCLGKVMAINQTMMTLAYVLYTLDLRRGEGDEATVGEGKAGAEWGRRRVDEFQVKDQLTSSKDGPYLQFRPRV